MTREPAGALRRSAASAAAMTLVAADPRADDAARRVTITGARVAISRHYRGIAMCLAVPLDAYRGIALTATATRAGFEVRLTHDDPELCVTLARPAQVEATIDEGRTWSATLGLPILVEDECGALAPLVPDADVQQARRQGHPLQHRRPRFLARRMPGVARAEVHRGEREIAGQR